MRRRLTQLKQAALPFCPTGSGSLLGLSDLLTAARRFAFLYLLEQCRAVPSPVQSLEAALARGQGGFYSEVLIPRCAELLGDVPESPAPISDEPFRVWHKLFGSWHWTLSEEADDETVSPGLLGALCELSLDQKTHGAYFTSRDATAYLCESVLLPALLASAEPLGADWRGRSGVDRFIRPPNLQPGLLPLETEYECAGRLARVERCRGAWQSGEIDTPDDWITWNLNLPLLVQDWVRSTTDTEALARFYRAVNQIRVLDPTCGSGAFLIAALETLLTVHHACRERLSNLSEARHTPDFAAEAAPVAEIVRRNLYGIDLAPEAVEACRMRLLLREASACDSDEGRLGSIGFNVRRADVLAEDVFSEVMRSFGGFDAVVGNPPYVAYASRGQYADAGYQTESCPNLYALVTERATQFLRENGRLGMILPVSSSSLPGFRPLTELLQRGKTWISSYSNRPAKLFPGVEQRLSIWITGPSDSPETYASAYQHWYAEERPYLFSRLSYAGSPAWLDTGMPIKTGCAVAQTLFRKITAHAGRLGSWEVTGGTAEAGRVGVWLHDGPTYWVRALAFDPNPEAPQGSGHYHRIPVADEGQALVLAALLSSTTFYFFFKMVSNCRDLGRKEWAAFRIDPLSPSQEHELETLGRQLQDRLRDTARLRSRRYPRGTVEYREYYPGGAKATLDAIDRVLAQHYRFSSAELDYLLNYDLKYRMGQNDDG